MPSPPRPHATPPTRSRECLSIPLDSPEARAFREQGVAAIDLGDFYFVREKIFGAPGRGLHFLLCVEGSVSIDGGAPHQPKTALLVEGGTALAGRRATPKNRFIHFAFHQGAPLLPEGAKTFRHKTTAGNPERLWQCLRHMAFDLQSPTPWRRETAALSAALSLRLLAFYLSSLDGSFQEDLRRDLDDLWSRVSAHLDEPWGLGDLAKLHGTSARQFDRHCRLVIGQSPMRHLAGLRLNRAKSLLATSHMAVSEVARLVGYGDPFAFSAAFKRRFAVSPRASRNR